MRRSIVTALLCGSALGSTLVASAAFAQAPNNFTIDEVVVTATRRTDTVHNVPLSIQAVSTEQVERQGLKTAQDIARSVPALRVGQTNGGGAGGGTGNADIAIRGVRSTTGAPTTGVYIDDVPLQQRSGLGGATGGGVVFPQLFDLERVEVLRGPQGTLYGGSSEGGTLRFITPSPNFAKYSAFLRGEASTVRDGDQNYELGASVGGPIVADKLAFQLAGWFRHDAGWVDHVSRFTGNTIAENTNSAHHGYYRMAVAWKPTDRATLTFSYLYSNDKYKDSDNYWDDFPKYSATVGPAAAPQTFTYGPYNFGPYKTGQNTNIGDKFYTSDAQLQPLYSPHQGTMRLPSLVMDYAFDKMSVKSVTAYTDVRNHALPDFSYVDVISRGGTPVEGSFNALPNNSAFIANLPLYTAKYDQRSRVRSLTEELRFSSNNPDSRLSWVGGVFFNHLQLKSDASITANIADVSAATIAGVSVITPPTVVYRTPQTLKETQVAAFGEATYKIDEHWRVTGGIRYTRDDFGYTLYGAGVLFGLPPTLSLTAQGSVAESPITPKVGVQYVVDQNINFYANAAKGFRPGGVNTILPAACTPGLVAAGFNSGTPPTYGSDTLWSYEGGAKVRAMGGRANINASVFRIDWKGVQTPITFPCGLSFTSSAGTVRSQGADVDAAIRLFPGFTLSGALAYTDAKYQATVATPVVIIGAGDRVPFTPKWSGSISAQYDFDIGRHRSFIRADYQFQSNIVLGLGPATSSYSPDNYRLSGNQYLTARAGMRFDKFDLSLFVNNITNSQDPLTRNGIASGPGRVSCTNGPACTTYLKNAVGTVLTTFKPRTFGIAASYRY